MKILPGRLEPAFVVDVSLLRDEDFHHAETGIIAMDQKAYPELSLRELRVLNALLQLRSITRTAHAMETTQPAISKMLQRLRGQFSDPLFVRNGNAMQPTAKALDVADRLRVLLAAADSLRSAATEFDPASSDRLFSLLLTDVGMIRFLPPLIARLAAIAPKISIRAVPLDARQFEHRLETGEADLAFGAFPMAARHLRRQRLYRQLFQRNPQASPAGLEIALAYRVSCRTPHPGDGIGDRARRTPNRAPGIVVCGRAPQCHASGSELYCRRHCRGGD
jgi:DNA-binding transcriptional LysR family regulator